jgi:hypothetical protein
MIIGSLRNLRKRRRDMVLSEAERIRRLEERDRIQKEWIEECEKRGGFYEARLVRCLRCGERRIWHTIDLEDVCYWCRNKEKDENGIIEKSS